MHLYILCRGIKHDLDRFIQELSAKYLPFKFHGEDKLVQVAVRPIQLYEIVFPREQLNTIIQTCQLTDGQESIGFLKKYSKIFRRFLHLDKIDYASASGAAIMPVYKQNIEAIGLGTKPDKDFPDGTEYL